MPALSLEVSALPIGNPEDEKFNFERAANQPPLFVFPSCALTVTPFNLCNLRPFAGTFRRLVPIFDHSPQPSSVCPSVRVKLYVPSDLAGCSPPMLR
jgi:hypothetical protein